MSHLLPLWVAALDWSKVTSKLPPDFGKKTLIFLAVVVVLVVAVKLYNRVNKIFLGIFLVVVGGVVFANWIYNRNEPAFLTPVIERLAEFFPTKGSERPQAGELDKTPKKK